MARNSQDVHAGWERALERRGPDAVRMLLRVSAGHDADMVFRGLMPEPPDPPRNFVENWLSAREAAGSRLGQRLVWPLVLLICVGALAWALVTYGEIELPKALRWPF